ncbi:MULTISPECIES: hypothetical protein [Micromonospora]|uniref:Uncharacterized protein n=1 Tax=Micromonospora solifontis TaxID=2487138 RepID=A0ABX9WAH7_9ACTN|nr:MULTISPECIES: hypothetical protein [Micromonospora]NES15911.1 hypothetical protein [Micromonospora sp. PPF5-17B]NES38961.1 hypothetical protein [Micromonospora solifontis]NES57902.1 hypothetical protein [Micromonospora sp. PPF5-6]RNL92254.1 hypothetical protein EFE23_22900 [Micromonospora solifontis]
MTTIGSENVTNGPGKPERFGGKYRGARRDTVLTEVVSADTELGGRDTDAPEQASPPLTLPSLDPNPLTEPSFPPSGWPVEQPESLVDHPLLRGLLMELPPKGSVPPPGWLDRWFEATRAILELLYVQGTGRSR